MTLLATREDKLGNLLKMEQGKDFGYCRETRSMTLTATSDIGDVLYADGANLKLAAQANVANVVAILIDTEVVKLRPASGTANVDVAVLVRGAAVVADTALNYNADINTAAEKTALYAVLAGLGIVVRKQV